MNTAPGAAAPRIVRFADIADRLPADAWSVWRNRVNEGEFADERVLWVPGPHELGTVDLASWPQPGDDPALLFMVVVDGDLRVETLYNWDTDGCTGLIVLGNLSLGHAVVGGQEIYVCGDLMVRELFWGDYNHGVLQVEGRIRARLLMATEEYDLPSGQERDGDEIVLRLDNEDCDAWERDLDEVAAQYFTEAVINRHETEPSGLGDVVPRYRVVEALARGEAVLRTPFALLQPTEVPRRWDEVRLTDPASMRSQTPLFHALIALVPEDEPEQPFRSQPFAADVFVTRAHRRQDNAQEVPDMLVVLGDDGLEVRMWVDQPGMLARLGGRSPGLAAMFEHTERGLRGFRPIWGHPEVVGRLQGVWNEALRRAEAWLFWSPRLQEEVRAADILRLLELPIVREHYNVWEDSDRNGFWDGFLRYAFHHPTEEEAWAVLRVNAQRQDTETFDTRGYQFKIHDVSTPGPVRLYYRSSQEDIPKHSPADRYCKGPELLSVFDAPQIEEALRWYARCAKRLPFCVPEELDDDEGGDGASGDGD